MMKSPFCSSSDDLNELVDEIKREIKLSNINLDPYSFVSPSAYDTAWLSMIEEDNNVGDDQLKPMFQDCLGWIMCNQHAGEGFWGNSGGYNPVADAGDEDGEEDMYILTSTLACVVALHKWNIGCLHLHKGTLTKLTLISHFCCSLRKLSVQVKRNSLRMHHMHGLLYCVIHVRILFI